MRLGDTGYTASITDGEVFRPRHNSLLSFNINQTAEGLSLTANPGFDQLAQLTAGNGSDGLGRALATAAGRQDAGLKPLLGALQFADRDVIAQQAGALRGDAHASLRLADNALVGSIGTVVQQHQAARRSGSGDAGGLAAQAAQAASAQPGMANGSLFNQLAMHLVEPAGAGGGSTDFGGEAPRNHGLWGRGFGSHGRIDGEGGVAGLSHTVGGIVLGADTQLADDRVTLGVSVAAADMSTKGRDGSGFSGDVRALDVGGYLDATYARGYLSASVRYTDLRHDTRRSIAGIDGLENPLRAKYSNDAISARLESLGRQQWLHDDGERLLASVANDEDRWPHLGMRSAQFLDPAAQRRLLRLLRWRDAQARASDRPRSWILDNELAATLARTPPADTAALGKLFEQFPKAPRKLAAAVWQALDTPLDDEADAPLAIQPSDASKKVMKELQEAVAERSRELGLADGVLASRKHLESYLEHRQWPAALAGWRQQELEARLQALLPQR
ncbi:MAG: autotransporter domain-containing protein [Stenotrophomonas sp.]